MQGTLRIHGCARFVLTLATLDMLITPAPLPGPRDQQQGGSRYLSRLELKSGSHENGRARAMGQVLTKYIQSASLGLLTQAKTDPTPGKEMTKVFSFSKQATLMEKQHVPEELSLTETQTDRHPHQLEMGQGKHLD